PHLLSHRSILGPSPNDLDPESEIVNHLAQELAAAEKWFDERQPQVGAGQRQRYPGQARSTTDVRNPLVNIKKLRDRGTIQYVAVPQPVHFSGTEQPPFDTRAGQDFRVPLRAAQPRSEEGLGRSRRRGHRHMFHVKHPPDLAGRKPTVGARTTWL